MLSRYFWLIPTAVLLATAPVRACPFCNAVSQTLRQEMSAMDAVVIATAIQSDATRNEDNGEVLMRVERVLKGDDLVQEGQEVKAVYFGSVEAGRRFMLSGVDPPAMQWSCLPVSKRAEDYIVRVTELQDDPLQRLRFYQTFLEDDDTMLARDAYDEFAIAPYDQVRELEPEMDHDQLVEWISDPETSTDRKRLYLTMLGVCGDEKDLPLLKELLSSTQKSQRAGLDAMIACYLTLAGEDGLPLINELFLANQKAPYADTYAAIMALRFHGTEGDVIARSALVESLHLVLERKDLADLVIPDLARWSDWSQIDRLTEMFIKADPENNWVRVPVVNYLRACPLPEAKKALEKLETVDPESVKRANTFFSIPVPAKETETKSSSRPRRQDSRLAKLSPVPSDVGTLGKPGQQTAAVVGGNLTPPFAIVPAANPWRLGFVLSLFLATTMIAQFLLLTGGPKPSVE